MHVTLAANFAIDRHGAMLDKQLKNLLKNHQSIPTIAVADEYFGPLNNVLVTPLEMSPALMKLHLKIINLLRSCGGVFDEPQYIDNGFRAHATIQKNSRLRQGKEVIIDEASLVDMYPNSDINRRKILATFKFTK